MFGVGDQADSRHIGVTAARPLLTPCRRSMTLSSRQRDNGV